MILHRNLVFFPQPTWTPGKLCPQIPTVLFAMGALYPGTFAYQTPQPSVEDICSIPTWHVSRHET